MELQSITNAQSFGTNACFGVYSHSFQVFFLQLICKQKYVNTEVVWCFPFLFFRHHAQCKARTREIITRVWTAASEESKLWSSTDEISTKQKLYLEVVDKFIPIFWSLQGRLVQFVQIWWKFATKVLQISGGGAKNIHWGKQICEWKCTSENTICLHWWKGTLHHFFQTNATNIPLIGVHVRRGDKLFRKNGKIYRLPNVTDVLFALEYMRQQFRAALFILASDDKVSIDNLPLCCKFHSSLSCFWAVLLLSTEMEFKTYCPECSGCGGNSIAEWKARLGHTEFVWSYCFWRKFIWILGSMVAWTMSASHLNHQTLDTVLQVSILEYENSLEHHTRIVSQELDAICIQWYSAL